MASKKCTVDGCDKKAWARGYCKKHYCRIAKTGDPSPAKIKQAATFEKQCQRCGKPFVTKRKSQVFCCHRCARFKHEGPCKVEGCGRKHCAHGLCSMHYHRLRESGKTGGPKPLRVSGRICKVEGCNRHAQALGFCTMHYGRVKSTGSPGMAAKLVGNGGINPDGYRVLYRPSHPNARTRGRIFEHTVVMSDYLGRPLRKGENIHHKNGIRHDNRIENLELWVSMQPSGQRVEDKIAFALELLRTYSTDEQLWPPGTAELIKGFQDVNVQPIHEATSVKKGLENRAD